MPPPLLLVCVDFSASTPAVLAHARRLAQDGHARVCLLHVAAPEPDFVGYDAPGGPHDREARADELTDERRELAQMADTLERDGVDVATRLLMGPTVEVVLETAERLEADQIVVGTHGHGALHRLLVGGTTEGLIRHATLPVTVVPRPEG